MQINKPHSLGAMVFACILSACGGGDVTGIGGSGSRVVGPIDAFGSIYVNGIKFEIDNAQVTLEGMAATTNDLRLGMVVVVDGIINPDGQTGTANMVAFNDAIQGPVESVTNSSNGDQKVLQVLGTEVRVDLNSTVFDAVTFDTINVNDLVEISGFSIGPNAIQATRIEKISVFSANSTVELKGTISDLSDSEFVINTIRVDFSNAEFEDISKAQLANGIAVEVEGNFDGTIIFADEIEKLPTLFGENVEDVHLQGFIGSFVDKFHFSISGQAIDATKAKFETGSVPLGNDVLVEVEGTIVNGILIATEVELPD